MDNVNFSEIEKSKCNKIIHGATLAVTAISGGLAQIPGSDAAVIAPIQIGMIVSLASVFNINLTKSSAGAVLANKIAEYIGRAAIKTTLRFIPGAGNIANAVISASITEKMGWSIAKDFKNQSILEEKRD
ncbi:hypothetical protein [Peptoniphilus stercorisuis]|uniref:Uncharacterized protein (DUF697 family) n=1 Tax=Peptoniphilus stercorisuis TaxID=1436965 RepID=A0ABS4KAF3_9FIRM|nr:hypothetical protein [Peptoniphilus stercorisuis]MBP2024755.1 uncharacterized protein (DUF697 family) [Peptoniphilus stercorisuis]